MKRPAFKSLLMVAMLAIFCSKLAAQTPAENLEKAVEGYNGLREYMDGFDSKTINADNLATMKTRMDKGVLLLDKVINEGNAEQVKAARYFKSNFKYEYGFAHGMKGENYQAFDVFKEIEKDFTAYSAADFPLRYSFFGKNFVINWENFAETQAEYFTSMAEISYNIAKFDDATRFNRLALGHANNTDWLRYVALNKMIDIYAKKSNVLTENEYFDYVLETIKAYDKLDDQNKETVKANNYPTVNRSAEILINKAASNPQGLVGRCAEAAPIAAKYEIGQANSLKLFEVCYRNQHPEIVEFHWVAVNLATLKYSTDKARAAYVGTAALDKIAEKLGSSDCEALPKIAEGYRSFGNMAKANAIDDRHRKCVAEQVVKRQKEEEQRQKQADEERKRQHRYEHPFNIYLGFNVLPLIAKPAEMDFGGHIDMRGRRAAHSFGYSIINSKNDLHSASENWDGFRAFYALKIFGKELRNQIAYSGLYFGYSEKDFQPLLGQINSRTDANDFRQEIVVPHDKQYDIVWNSGVQALGKGMGIDIWYGIGASYYQLSYDEFDWEQYTISGHDFFESRDEKDSFSIYMRLGLSIGLNLGRKR